MNGNSQAVLLPKDFRFDGDSVFIRHQGDNLILSSRALTWDEFFESPHVFGEDFLTDRDQDLPQEREWC